ncbi:MAG: hypothetical protein KGR98_08615 [Verrucomicrobia bacterium]|nr:hypothetical protein [Verrucomicrobiota bacterium]MDE3099942.1 hypothetical protein [Verrucomicrobiota bacterium]
MIFKHFIAMFVLETAIPLSIVANCISRMRREINFFLMIALTSVTFMMDVNFDSYFWYRSATRGFEFSIVAILAVGVLACSLLFPGAGRRRWFWPASLGLMLLCLAYGCDEATLVCPGPFKDEERTGNRSD